MPLLLDVVLVFDSIISDQGVHALLGAVPLCPVAILLRDADSDEADRAILHGAVHQPIGIAIVEKLTQPAALRHRGLAGAVVRMFCDPHRLVSIPDLRDLAGGMSRRTVERWLASIGFHSLHDLVAAARVSRAYGQLADDRVRAEAIAKYEGFGDVRTLRLKAKDSVGLDAIALRPPRTPSGSWSSAW